MLFYRINSTASLTQPGLPLLPWAWVCCWLIFWRPLSFTWFSARNRSNKDPKGTLVRFNYCTQLVCPKWYPISWIRFCLGLCQFGLCASFKRSPNGLIVVLSRSLHFAIRSDDFTWHACLRTLRASYEPSDQLIKITDHWINVSYPIFILKSIAESWLLGEIFLGHTYVSVFWFVLQLTYCTQPGVTPSVPQPPPPWPPVWFQVQSRAIVSRFYDDDYENPGKTGEITKYHKKINSLYIITSCC